MIQAGSAVDTTIDQLLHFLEKGDIVIDGGNSFFEDTKRREIRLAQLGISFFGCGVSGGEEGARYGPSIMPGGNREAWEHIRPIFQSISAKVDGIPCCEYIGEGASGHYVKMVHNGIEYGDIQLICEAYHLLKDVLHLNHDEMANVFKEWNTGELDSFLIDITSQVLSYRDEHNEPLVDKIRDAAGQKGTGKWTVSSSLDLGTPVTLIGEAVFARCLSALKDERVKASTILKGPLIEEVGRASRHLQTTIEKKSFTEKIRRALYASKIVSYAQGFMLLREVAKQEKWSLNYGAIAMMWRGGCIIRSAFLHKIKEAFDMNPNLTNLLLHNFFRDAIDYCQDSWRLVISQAVLVGIPLPAFSTALAFYDGYRTARLPANLLQALRDYFGAHTYELLDRPGTFVHTDWTGHGGKTHAGTYTV